MRPLVEQLIQAIEKSGKTRYEISKATGVAQSQLSRLVHGENRMNIDNIERVAAYLEFEVVLSPKRKPKRKG
jgi:transcriptional regulator with XRE-family HTH domain